MMQRIAISLTLILTAFGIFAQNTSDEESSILRKYSNEFLSIGVGARALAMGNTCIASTNDATSAYWNPAGLTYIKNDLQLSAMHAEYFAGIGKYDYLGGGAKLNNGGAIGATIVRFGVDDIPNTLDLIDSDGNIRYDRIKSFSVADYAFIISYAMKSKIEGLRYGANIKVIRRKAGDFASAWGFGFDFGARYDRGNWRFAAMARDVTSTFNAWSFNTEELEETFILTGNELPDNSVELTLPKLLLGTAYKYKINDNFGGLAEIDLDITFDGKRNVLIKSNPISIDPHLGLEFYFRDYVFLRAGMSNMQMVPDYDNTNDFTFQPSLGLGVCFKGFCIDYAFTDIGDQSIALYSHVFSVSYSIRKSKPASMN